jgi:hypothetical protein
MNSFLPLLATNTDNLSHFLYRFFPKYLKISGLKGAVVECGVGYGRSALLLIQCAEILEDKCNFFFFDSFEGFPELSSEDKNQPGQTSCASKGEWNYIQPSDLVQFIAISFKHNKERAQEVLAKTSIIKGFVEDSLTDEMLAKISAVGGIKFLHLDVDLYSAYKTCLERLYDLVVPGGVVCFDEYHTSSLKKFPGSKRAIIEFFNLRGIDANRIMLDAIGKAYYFKV